MLLKTIAGLLSRLRRLHSQTEPIPAAIIDRLGDKRAITFKGEFKAALEASKDRESLLKKCVAVAEQHAWPEDEIEKLRIYAAYFSGNVRYAYTQITGRNYHLSDADLFVMACISLYVDDRFKDAAELLEQRDVLGDDFAANREFVGFAGYIMIAAGNEFPKGIAYFDAALERGDMFQALAINAYPIYFEAGQLEKADYLRRVIHERYANNPEALYCLGCIELTKNYYAEGFRLCEARYLHPEASRFINMKLFEKPRWESGPIEGKRLLVHAEQGFGDNIMCARYLPELLKMAATVMLECQEAAAPLISANFPGVEIIPIHQKRADTAPFDYWVGAMSLPHLFNNTAETIPGRAGYLKAPQEHLDHWRSRLASLNLPCRLKVGVAWSGNPIHRNDFRRSISFDFFSAYLKDLGSVNFFALQTEVPQTDLPLVNLSEELVTLADTAALIEQMDLVITVDTSIVHLAGALGKETWLLLPYRYEWRWGLEGTSNAWYDSVRLIRQTSNGNWKGVLDQVFLHDLPDLLTFHDKAYDVAH